mgnify:CR=1 FL=1
MKRLMSAALVAALGVTCLGGVGRPAQNVHYDFEIALAESRFEKTFGQGQAVELGELLPARLVGGSRIRDDAVPIKKRSDYFFHSKYNRRFCRDFKFFIGAARRTRDVGGAARAAAGSFESAVRERLAKVLPLSRRAVGRGKRRARVLWKAKIRRRTRRFEWKIFCDAVSP